MKYEYFQTTLVLTDSTLRDQLNELGDMGWEMVNAIPVHGTSHMTYVFKKAKSSEDRELLKEERRTTL